MSLQILDKVILNAIAVLLLASVLIRARMSYPVIRDLPLRQRNTWAFPLIAQGAIPGLILLINLSTLLETFGLPWLLQDLLALVICVCAFAPALTLIGMGLRSKLDQARKSSGLPEDRSPKGPGNEIINW